jgi:hypothetical protein
MERSVLPPAESAAAIVFLLWAALIGLGMAWILLVDRSRSFSRAWLWRPPRLRRFSLRRLERQILRAVVRTAVLDTEGVRLLPNQVEVLLAPVELGELGLLADHIAENVAQAMADLGREGSYRLAGEPSIALVPAASHQPGRLAIRTRFGQPTTTVRTAGRSEPPGGQPGGELEEDPVVLRRLEPQGKPTRLRRRHIRVGRRYGCDLAISEPTVSRRHASVYRRANGWHVRDYGSTNGTFVNGSRVASSVKLADGDEIRLGFWVRLRFERSPLRSA